MRGNNNNHKERKLFSRGEEKLALADLFKDQVTNIHKKRSKKIEEKHLERETEKNVWRRMC